MLFIFSSLVFVHVALLLHFSVVEWHTSSIKEFCKSLECCFYCIDILWINGFMMCHAFRNCLVVFAARNKMTYVNCSSLFVKVKTSILNLFLIIPQSCFIVDTVLIPLAVWLWKLFRRNRWLKSEWIIKPRAVSWGEWIICRT